MPICIHFENDFKHFKEIFLGLLFLLFLSGFYKNSLNYYFFNQLNLIETLKPLLFLFISLGVSVIFNFFRKKSIWQDLEENLILSLIIPPAFPLLIYLFLIIAYNFGKIKLKNNIFSNILFFKIITIIISTFFLKINYENIIEQTNPYFYGTLDLFLGKNVGNFGTTSILLLIFIFILLSCNFYYKKEMPIWTILSYSVPIFVFSLIKNDFLFTKEILNSHLWFTAIFLVPLNKYSPVSKKWKIIYSVLVGIISFLLINILKIEDGVYIALLFVEFIWGVANHFLNKGNNLLKIY